MEALKFGEDPCDHFSTTPRDDCESSRSLSPQLQFEFDDDDFELAPTPPLSLSDMYDHPYAKRPRLESEEESDLPSGSGSGSGSGSSATAASAVFTEDDATLRRHRQLDWTLNRLSVKMDDIDARLIAVEVAINNQNDELRKFVNKLDRILHILEDYQTRV